MGSSAAGTTDVFRSAGTAMATRIVLTEQTKTIVRPSLVRKTNLSVQREGPTPRPSALIRPNCATENMTAMTVPTKKMLAVRTIVFFYYLLLSFEVVFV